METKTSFEPGNRYRFDFNECTGRNGWAQIDTPQDAAYFGQWANPITLEIRSYCEGDVTRKKCDTGEEFAAEIRAIVEWTKENQGAPAKIDGMCRPEIIDAFKTLGLGEYLH